MMREKIFRTNYGNEKNKFIIKYIINKIIFLNLIYVYIKVNSYYF